VEKRGHGGGAGRGRGGGGQRFWRSGGGGDEGDFVAVAGELTGAEAEAGGEQDAGGFFVAGIDGLTHEVEGGVAVGAQETLGSADGGLVELEIGRGGAGRSSGFDQCSADGEEGAVGRVGRAGWAWGGQSNWRIGDRRGRGDLGRESGEGGGEVSGPERR